MTAKSGLLYLYLFYDGGPVQHSAVQHSAVQHSADITAQCSTAQCRQYSTVQYNTVQYSSEDHTYFVVGNYPPPPPAASNRSSNGYLPSLNFYSWHSPTVLGYTLLTCIFMFTIIGLVEHTEYRWAHRVDRVRGFFSSRRNWDPPPTRSLFGSGGRTHLLV